MGVIRTLKARLREHGPGYFWTERHGGLLTVIGIAIGAPCAVVPGHVSSGDGRHRVVARFDSQSALARWLTASSS